MTMLSDKVVIVTGAAGGIGSEASRAFARAGAKVMLVDLSPQPLDDLKRSLDAEGLVTETCVADISDEAAVAAMVDRTVETFGRLDGAFNNAGLQQSNLALHEMSAEVWARSLQVNLAGCFYCIKHEVRVMLESGGAIVNTASGLSAVAIPNASEYIAAKHGVVGLTKAAAVEYATRGIRVNAIMPGVVETPMLMRLLGGAEFEGQFEDIKVRHPMGRLAKTSDIAAGAAWLLSDQAGFVTGVALPIDGGYLAI